MGGAVFVIGEQFSEHWQRAQNAGFWESVREVPVEAGDTLVFWLGGESRLLGLATATHPAEAVDYSSVARPWLTGDTADYQHRYRFRPLEVNEDPALRWSSLMEMLGQNRQRGANSAPFSFDDQGARRLLEYLQGARRDDGGVDVATEASGGLSRISRESVIKAMVEFDQLGRSQFLNRYGFSEARDYFAFHNGHLYDSKALVGAAHGFEDGLQPLRPNEFSGGEQTVVKRLVTLGVRVLTRGRLGAIEQVDPDPNWQLRQGDSIRRSELHRLYGGSRQDGVSPSRATPNVLVFTDQNSGEQHGYFDEWRGGTFYYTGRGQHGDQTFTSGNKAILQHLEEGRALRLFEGVGGTVTYRGRFGLADDQPWIMGRAPETGGGPDRNVIIFRMVPIGVGDDGSDDLAVPPNFEVSLDEALGRDFHERNDQVAVRGSMTIVDPDATGRGLNAHRTTENKVGALVRARGLIPRDPPVSGPAYDLAWTDGETLFVCEVKSLTGMNQTGQIRLGLGQLLDYTYQLRSRGHLVEPLLIVEREPDDPHWGALCAEHGVKLTWPSDLSRIWEASSIRAT